MEFSLTFAPALAVTPLESALNLPGKARLQQIEK